MKIYDFDGTLFNTSPLHQRSFQIFAEKLAIRLYGIDFANTIDKRSIIKQAKALFQGEADPVVFHKILSEEAENETEDTLKNLIMKSRDLLGSSLFVETLSMLRRESLYEAYNEMRSEIHLQILSEFKNIDMNEKLVIVTSNYEGIVDLILRDTLQNYNPENILLLGNETLLQHYNQHPDLNIPGKPNPYLLNLAVEKIIKIYPDFKEFPYIGDSKTDKEMVINYNDNKTETYPVISAVIIPKEEHLNLS